MTRDSHTDSRILRLVVSFVAISVLMASCGDDDDSASTDGSATTEVTNTTQSDDLCDDRDALQSSVAALGEIDVSAEGTNGVETAVGAVEDDLAALRDSADSELTPQIDAVEEAIDELGPAVEDIDSGGAAEAATAIANVATAAATLIESLEAAACE